MSQLVTGEAVALDLRPAGLPSRVVAGIVDAAVQLALLFAVLPVALGAASSGSSARGAAFVIVSVLLVALGYPVACESLSRGRTPGKALLGLRVVRDDGGPVGFRQSFVRGIVGFAVERPGVTFFVGAVVTSLLNARGKRLGDLLAGTVVLQERVAAPAVTLAQMPPGLAGWASLLDLGALPDSLAMSVRQFVGRSPSLTPAAREELGGTLVRSVLACTAPPPPPGTPGWAVLAAVLAERRHREQSRAPQVTPAGAHLPPVRTPSGPAGPPAGPGPDPGGFAPPG